MMEKFVNEMMAYFGTPNAFKDWLRSVKSDCKTISVNAVEKALPHGYKLATYCNCNYDDVYAESLIETIYVGKTYDGKKILF